MDISFQLKSAILSQSLPPPSSSLLTSLTTARTPPPPLPSLVATARARLLACDLTSSSLVDASIMTLPASACDPTTKQLRLSTGVHVQVVDVENLSLSRWEQAEELEAVERGERTQGRQVIRIDDSAGADEGSETQTQQGGGARPSAAQAAGSAPGKNTTHRLTLQDRSGTRIFALELRRMPNVGVNTTSIGEKILLKAGTVVARGTVMLTPETCLFLGGKIDAWNRSWAAGRLARLKDSMEAAGEQ